MKKATILVVFFGLFLPSCYFVDDIFDPDEPEIESLQKKSEDAVANYLDAISNYTYKPYGFGPITITKPIEIKELEDLERNSTQANTLNPKQDSLIAQKRRFIVENNIHKTISLDHFFILKDTANNTKVYETKFVLNDTLAVENLVAKIKLELPYEYISILDLFFYEQPIFIGESYQDSKVLSQNFYGFFKKELENKQSLKAKSDFLMHALKMTREVKIKGEFDQQYVMERQVREHMLGSTSTITNYESNRFSPLYETINNADSSTIGYYFFHKFIGSFQEETDTSAVLIEFSKFYELGNIYELDRPFNQYFEN